MMMFFLSFSCQPNWRVVGWGRRCGVLLRCVKAGKWAHLCVCVSDPSVTHLSYFTPALALSFFRTFYIFLGFCVISPSTHTKKKAGPPLCYSFEFNFNFWNTTVPPLHLFLFLEQGVYCFYEFIAGFLSMFSISVFNDRAFSRWMNYLNSPAQLTGNFLKQFLVHRMWNELSKWKKQTGLSHLFLFIGREPFLCGWPSN